MKTITILFLCLSLVSCYQVVDKRDILKAESICEHRGGVHEILAFATGMEKINCVNGYSRFMKMSYSGNKEDY